MKPDASFWNAVAEKYAADPIGDMAAYEYTLGRTRSYLSTTDKVIELGAGTSSTALALAPGVARYLATDISSEMVRIGREKLADAEIDTLDIEVGGFDTPAYQGAGFDAVLAFNVLHLVPDIPRALKSAAGMLRPGGLLITKTVCLGSRSLPMRTVFKTMIAGMQAFGKAPKPVHFPTVGGMDRHVIAAGFDLLETGNYPAKAPSRYIVARKR
ncbi:MAG: class I SAM-dependent methyltransferase [Pseudomonadota bacterium]